MDRQSECPKKVRDVMLKATVEKPASPPRSGVSLAFLFRHLVTLTITFYVLYNYISILYSSHMLVYMFGIIMGCWVGGLNA